MSSVTLELPDETRRLEEKAARNGQPLAEYIRGVLEAETTRLRLASKDPGATPPGEISVEEFERRLDTLTEGIPPVQPLPDDFARDDILVVSYVRCTPG